MIAAPRRRRPSPSASSTYQHHERRHYLIYHYHSFLSLFLVFNEVLKSSSTSAFLAASPPSSSSNRRSHHLTNQQYSDALLRRKQHQRRQASLKNDPLPAAMIIDIAYIAAKPSDDNNGCFFNDLTRLLEVHSFSEMTGVQLNLSNLPTSSVSWTNENLSLLHKADILCFTNHVDVQSYLRILDDHLGIPTDIKEEDRRKLPNKPILMSDDDEEDDSSSGDSDVTAAGSSSTFAMAACPSYKTARECLKSGRWVSNHIYYPKNEMKMNGGGDGDDTMKSDEGEEGGKVNVEAWVNSIVQAAGDVMERKFWGGGW
jgi:hypothetical protein